MINSAYNISNNTMYSFIEAMPSREAVSTAFSEGFDSLKDGASGLKDFLYNVLFVDLHDMELSQAAEYRTYKIALAVIITIASIAAGAYFAHSAYLACFLKYPNTLAGVLSILTKISLPIVGSIMTPTLGCMFAMFQYACQVQDYDHTLKLCSNPRTDLSLRENARREALENEMEALDAQCKEDKDTLETLHLHLEATKATLLRSPMIGSNEDFQDKLLATKEYMHAQEAYDLTLQRFAQAQAKRAEKEALLAE